MLASGSYDNTIKLWDIVNGEEIATLVGHNFFVNTVCFSPCGKVLASGSNDNTIKIWDTVTYNELTTLIGHKKSISSICFQPQQYNLLW